MLVLSGGNFYGLMSAFAVGNCELGNFCSRKLRSILEGIETVVEGRFFRESYYFIYIFSETDSFI